MASSSKCVLSSGLNPRQVLAAPQRQPASHPAIPFRGELLWGAGRGGGRAHLGGRCVYLFCYNVAAAAVVTTRPHVVRVVGRSQTACRFGAPGHTGDGSRSWERGQKMTAVAEKKNRCALLRGHVVLSVASLVTRSRDTDSRFVHSTGLRSRPPFQP